MVELLLINSKKPNHTIFKILLCSNPCSVSTLKQFLLSMDFWSGHMTNEGWVYPSTHQLLGVPSLVSTASDSCTCSRRRIVTTALTPHVVPSSGTSSSGSSLPPPLQTRHLQQTIQGAASRRRGDATKSRMPNPAKIPITCVRCHITLAREWPSLFLQGPLS